MKINRYIKLWHVDMSNCCFLMGSYNVDRGSSIVEVFDMEKM